MLFWLFGLREKRRDCLATFEFTFSLGCNFFLHATKIFAIKLKKKNGAFGSKYFWYLLVQKWKKIKSVFISLNWLSCSKDLLGDWCLCCFFEICSCVGRVKEIWEWLYRLIFPHTTFPFFTLIKLSMHCCNCKLNSIKYARQALSTIHP